MTFEKPKPWPMVGVPVFLEPAAAKYLRHQHSEPFVVNLKSLLGSVIQLSLQKKVHTIASLPPVRCKELTAVYKCSVTAPVAYRQGTEVGWDSCFHINKLVLRAMYAELMLSLLYGHLICGKTDIQPCIEEFRDCYDILEKELPDERLRKMYYRIRKSHGEDPAFYVRFLPSKLLFH